MKDHFSQAFREPDRRPIYEWAAENVSLPSVLTKTGLFDVSTSRHFMLPFDWLKSETVREVNIMAPVRSGKTLIADVAAPWAILNEHASLLWVFQNDELATSHSELRAMPTLLSVPGIRSMLPDDRHKQRSDEIVFNNGLPFIICGPAISNLQSRGFKWVFCDEPWLYKPGILENAKARLGDFVKTANSKFLAISQGGVEDDDWETQFKSGEIHEWKIRCDSCGHYMPPEWSAFRQDGTRWGIMFDGEKDERGNYNLRKAIESLRFECQKCGHAHLDTTATRNRWNLSGKYESEGQASDTRKSAHWTALIDYPWADLLEQWLAARKAASHGNMEPTIIFVQKRLARPKSEKTVHEGSLQFVRAEITNEKWDTEILRCITVDRQSEDVYWLTARAWSKEPLETRRLLFKRCYSESDIIAAADEINPTVIEVVIGGARVRINAVFVDSGYRPKGDQGVYAMCARHGWAALKGTDEAFFHHTITKKDVQGKVTVEKVQRSYAPWSWGDPGEGTSEQGRKHAPLLRFSSNTLRDRMQELIESGKWVEPEGDQESDLGREYDRQMSSEFRKKKVNKFTGKEEFQWVCPSGNNHAADCGKMQTLVATITKIL